MFSDMSNEFMNIQCDMALMNTITKQSKASLRSNFTNTDYQYWRAEGIFNLQATFEVLESQKSLTGRLLGFYGCPN